MPVSKKPPKQRSATVHDFIVSKPDGDKLYFQQVRIAQKYIDQIDRLCQDRRMKTARHAWLLEAIFEKLDREEPAASTVDSRKSDS